MRGGVFGLAWLLLMLPVQGAAAADGWVLALSWQPGFCAGHSNAPDCREATAPRLTLHGLWPEANRSEEEDFCAVAPDEIALDQKSAWCRLPAPAVSPQTAAAMDRVMPGRLACLDRHEWLRHGTCSGLTADAYFATAVRLATRVKELAIGRMLVSRAGREISFDDLTRAVTADFGSEAVPAFTFVCAERNNVPDLIEIRVSLTVDGLRVFPAPAALHIPGFRAAHSCPANKLIRIDGAR